MTGRVVAIDGPAGSGKSTTARAVARALGFAHLDSGALYRAITLAALDTATPLEADRLVGLARTLPVRLVEAPEGFRPEVAGTDVSEAVRSERVTRQVSDVAALPAVRAWVNDRLRAAAQAHPRGIVADGRDIGSVVFPDAGLKVFLTADEDERARRRLRQTGEETGEAATARVRSALAARDARDRRRTVAPLRPAPDAVLLDTTQLTFDDQVARVVHLARRAYGQATG